MSSLWNLGRFVLFSWSGSRIHRTLAHILQYVGWPTTPSISGYYLEIGYDGNAIDLLTELRELSSQVPILVKSLVAELKALELWQGKYDYLAPRALLEKAYVDDVLDVSGTVQWLASCS